MKTAFLYVGQGSQVLGMGKLLLEKFDGAKELFERANNALGWDVLDLCLNGPEDKLNDTKWTQPALLTCSYIAHQAALNLGFKPDYALGLSLGEYSAIAANGGLSLEDGVKLVHARGTIMAEAVPKGVGTMYAILGLEIDAINKVCDQFKDQGVIAAANINCPGQIVVGGKKEVVDGAIEAFKAAGAKRCIELNVAGPFHTSMLEEASNTFKAELDKYSFNTIETKLITNTTGDIVDEAIIRENLQKQMYCSVQLEKGIKKLLDEGVTQFIELGPNNVISGFVKKTAKHYGFEGIEVFNIESKLGDE